MNLRPEGFGNNFVCVHQQDPGRTNLDVIESPLTFLWVTTAILELNHLGSSLKRNLSRSIFAAGIQHNHSLRGTQRGQASADVCLFVASGNNSRNWQLHDTPTG